jgi:hypothetical protein
MAKRRYPQTTFYHLLAAYADVLSRATERGKQAQLYPFKLPPQTIGLSK